MLVTVLPLFSQKKEIQQVKTYLKAGKELDKAEALARKVLTMPGMDRNIEVHGLLAESIRRQYESMNEKLYLKTLKDTASVFPMARKMFLTYEVLDSIDAQPDKNGKVSIKYRKKNAEYLNRFRKNLFSGSVFFTNKQNFKEAYDCADVYLDCERQPLFTSYNYAQNDTTRIEAACVAVNSASKLKDLGRMQKYSDIALQHPSKSRFVLEQLYEAYLTAGDTINAVSCLRQGFDRFPEHNFFFPRLADYYMQRHEMDTVSNIVSRALELEPGNLFYRMAQNTVLLNTGRYDECIEQGDSLLHTNDHMTNAYFNVGSAYFNKALLVEKSSLSTRTKRKEANILYEKARPYIERYRKMRPRRKHQWAQMLYTIYLNLNMGKEFEEIDQIIKNND